MPRIPHDGTDIQVWKPSARAPKKHRLNTMSQDTTLGVLYADGDISLMDVVEGSNWASLRTRSGWVEIPRAILASLRRASACERFVAAAKWLRAARAAHESAYLACVS